MITSRLTNPSADFREGFYAGIEVAEYRNAEHIARLMAKVEECKAFIAGQEEIRNALERRIEGLKNTVSEVQDKLPQSNRGYQEAYLQYMAAKRAEFDHTADMFGVGQAPALKRDIDSGTLLYTATLQAGMEALDHTATRPMTPDERELFEAMGNVAPSGWFKAE